MPQTVRWECPACPLRLTMERPEVSDAAAMVTRHVRGHGFGRRRVRRWVESWRADWLEDAVVLAIEWERRCR